jgi:hypothetical protein
MNLEPSVWESGLLTLYRDVSVMNWKEWAGGVYLRYYSGICLDRPRKTIKLAARIADIWAEIRTWNLPDTRL